MFKSVKSKFIFFSIFLIFLTTVIPMYFLISQFRANFKDRSVVMLETTLDIIRYGLNFAMMSGHPEDLQNMIDELSQKENIYRIRIFNANGIVKFSSIREEINTEISMISPHHSDFKQTETNIVSVESGDEIYSSIEPILNSKPCQSCHQEENLIAFLDLDTYLTKAENKFYTGSIHMIILGWVVIFVLIIGLYLIFSIFINSPLQKLMNALNDVERGNLNVRLDDIRKDEIGTVYKHFNAMTSNLKSSREKIDQLHMGELQRLDRLKTLGELTSQMAHEINNHIAVIMTRADYLQLESGIEPLLNKYISDFEVIFKQTEKLSSITHNILKHSKKSPKKFIVVDLCNSIDNILLMIQPTCKKSNINCFKNTNLNEALIYADPLQIEQVLINLVNNSIDAIGENGQIKISLKKENEDELKLSVDDDGCGISEENLEQIFSPFFTSKSAEKGTGLGLYITKNICDNHNVDIKCISKVGAGTNFTLKIKSI